MEKRKWLWKRKSSERSPGETESSGSISSLSERFSDEQDTLKAASPSDDTHSPEVTSKTAERDEVVNESIKHLTQRLSAALVNVSAKDDLVKQHAKVAEEAVAGWEKAENEVSALKKKLEAAVQQNSALEDRVSHLDGALKECVRQLRQAREEQEEKVQEAVARKTREWESAKSDLENQLLELKVEAETAKSEFPQIDLDLLRKLEYLEKDNASLKLELLSLSEELEVRTIERDLSTQAAETASKQHLESIKKVAKLEAECRRLKALACKATSLNDHKASTASSIYVESLTDGQSDSGERLNAVDVDTCKVSCLELYKCEPSCSDSWASALIAELDQFKNEKAIHRNLPSSSIEIDLMDDFLEMERLAAMPAIERETHHSEPQAISKQSIDAESSLRAELEVMIHQTADLEEKLQKMEGEKVELEEKLEKILLEKTEMEMTLTISQENNEELQIQLREAELKLKELQQELYMANESKEQIESQLVVMEAEAWTMVSKVNSLEEEAVWEKALSAEITAKCKALEEELSKKVNSLEAEAEREKVLSAEIAAKCKALEEELSEKKQEVELQKSACSNNEPKLKQEDLAAAAGKLAECQKTIASLGKQLKSLATLEDFLIDTGNLTELSAGGSLIARDSGDPWGLHSSEIYSTSSSIDSENSGPSLNKNEGHSPPSSLSTSSAASNHVSSEKNRNGFAKFFSRSKNGIQLEI